VTLVLKSAHAPFLRPQRFGRCTLPDTGKPIRVEQLVLRNGPVGDAKTGVVMALPARVAGLRNASSNPAIRKLRSCGQGDLRVWKNSSTTAASRQKCCSNGDGARKSRAETTWPSMVRTAKLKSPITSFSTRMEVRKPSTVSSRCRPGSPHQASSSPTSIYTLRHGTNHASSWSESLLLHEQPIKTSRRRGNGVGDGCHQSITRHDGQRLPDRIIQ